MRSLRIATILLALVAVCYAGFLHSDRVGNGHIRSWKLGRGQHGRGRGLGHARVQYGETEDFEMIKDNVRSTLRLKKLDMDSSKMGIGAAKKTAVYGDTDTVLQVECDNEDLTDNCKEFALVSNGGETVFLTNDKAIVLPDKNGSTSALDPSVLDEITGTSNVPRNGTRTKRQTLPNSLTDARVLKVIMFVDRGLVDWFLPMYDDNLADTKDGIIHYLTLTVNQMTMHYQTLRDYIQPLYVDGVAMEMNIAVALVDVEFPPGNTATSNWPWSADHFVDGELRVYFSEITNQYSGAFTDFRSYVRNDFTTQVPYDHAMAVTGYDLSGYITETDGNVDRDGLLGQAWRNAVCDESNTDRALHTSIVEFDRKFPRTAAHETGHNLGMSHDRDHSDAACPNFAFVMSTSIFSPQGEDQAQTFYRFSQCSALDVADYTEGISDWISTCMLPPDQAFLVHYCKGLPGQLSFDDQCQAAYPGTTRDTDDDSAIEANLQAGYVDICTATLGQTQFPISCKSTSSSSTHRIFEARAGTKCIAPDGSRNPNYICYNGQCMANTQLCDGVVVTEAPTTSTTEAPTTIPSTEAPTTTVAAAPTTTVAAAPTTTTASKTTTSEHVLTTTDSISVDSCACTIDSVNYVTEGDVTKAVVETSAEVYFTP